jgi:hypothetical protein
MRVEAEGRPPQLGNFDRIDLIQITDQDIGLAGPVGEIGDHDLMSCRAQRL